MSSAKAIQYCWDRLPLGEQRQPAGPSLREDWFVADALAAGSRFIWRGRDLETSHRLLFRFATASSWERGRHGGAPEWLVLHQMVDLIPVMFAAAGRIALEQGRAAA